MIESLLSNHMDVFLMDICHNQLTIHKLEAYSWSKLLEQAPIALALSFFIPIFHYSSLDNWRAKVLTTRHPLTNAFRVEFRSTHCAIPFTQKETDYRHIPKTVV